MPLHEAPPLRALRGDRPDRLPVWLMRQAGRSLPEYRERQVVRIPIVELAARPPQ